MKNRNEDRIGAVKPDVDPVVMQAMQSAETSQDSFDFDFPEPTEFVELPSRGRCYPESHPLHGVDSIELKYPTTKAEDILNSKSLIKQGLAVDRFLQKIICDPRIRTQDLFIGDKNSLIVASRIMAYGEKYDATVTCPNCMQSNEISFNLEECSELYEASESDYEYCGAKSTDRGTFLVTVPKTKWVFEIKWLDGKDEEYLAKLKRRQKKHKLPESEVTDALRLVTVAINGTRDQSKIVKAIEKLPAIDAQYLRVAIKAVTPTLELKHDFECKECNAATEVNVPFGVNFFWGK